MTVEVRPAQLVLINTSLIVQVRPTQLVHSSDRPYLHRFDSSSQTSLLNSSSLNTMCLVWIISASQLHAPGTD